MPSSVSPALEAAGVGDCATGVELVVLVEDALLFVGLDVSELDEFEDEDPAFDVELEVDDADVEPEEELPELDVVALLEEFLGV